MIGMLDNVEYQSGAVVRYLMHTTSLLLKSTVITTMCSSDHSQIVMPSLKD